MAVNEQIVTGRAKRVLIDKATKLWQRISEWTKASDVEFNDAKTAETKVGAIDGITDSLVSTSSRIAASAKSVNQLSNNLAQQPNFIYDSSGKITGYKTQAGADTVFPFSSGPKYVEVAFIVGSYSQNNNYYTATYRAYHAFDGETSDQHLLSASGYYNSGWHLNISVSSKASGSQKFNGYSSGDTFMMAIAWIN